jgi:putative aldouronate transport system permease protein
MYYRKTVVQWFSDVLIYAGLALLAFVCLAPVLHVIMASFSDPFRLDTNMSLLLKPLGFTLKGYQLVFTIPSIKTGYLNTVVIVVAGTLVNIVLTSLGAYVLAQRNWFFGRIIMVMVVVTMFFSGGLIPTFLLVRDLNLVNNRLALILPGAVAAWNLIIMRTAFMTVPDSLIESPKMDGAHDFTILFRITLPLSKAVLAVITLFYAVGHWNSWFDAMIYIRDRTKYPLQVILREVLVDESTTAPVTEMSKVVDPTALSVYRKLIKYTTIVVSTVPVLCFYPFIQKYFVKGIMIGSLKG